MRNIEELLHKYPGKRIWFYLSTKKLRRSFMKEAFALEAIYPDKNTNSAGWVMAFGDDRRLAHVSLYIWCMSFQLSSAPGLANVVKVDYEKFKRGEDDYICHKPYITGYIQQTGSSSHIEFI